MTTPQPVQFKGVPGSPYTRKMLAYLRFRHIPYQLLIGDQAATLNLPTPKVNLLPTFYLPDENQELQAVVDSTPLIRRFEAQVSGRAAIPDDPALAFINYLLEDYADEWLTKAMFHYRWYYQADINFAGTILPRWSNIQAPEEQLQAMQQYVADRQITRLYVVGSNKITAPVIEASYQRFLQIMDTLIQQQPYILGTRPCSADFAIYAQLTQLAKFDPTPAAICVAQAPRIYAWTDLVDDLSGAAADNNQGWMDTTKASAVLTPLLTEIGRTYVPFLLANAEAARQGQAQMETTIDALPWVQPTFPYQAKCLHSIAEEYQQLDATSQASVDKLLTGTGCRALIRGAA